MNEPLEEDVEFLAHYGVKGMRWGQRQAARARSHKQGPIEKKVNRGLRKVHNTVAGTPSSSAKKTSTPTVKKATNPPKAARVTLSKGEKIGSVLLGGPVGYLGYRAVKQHSANKAAALPKSPKAKADRVKLTTGEKAVSIMFAGPVGYYGYRALKQHDANAAA